MQRIFHITTREEFESAKEAGAYLSAAFEQDGFIHCSFRNQVTEVANHKFAGQQNMLLLEIARDRVPAQVRDENLEGGQELFPHIYGPLPLEAVLSVRSFLPNSNGRFELPEDLPK